MKTRQELETIRAKSDDFVVPEVEAMVKKIIRSVPPGDYKKEENAAVLAEAIMTVFPAIRPIVQKDDESKRKFFTILLNGNVSANKQTHDGKASAGRTISAEAEKLVKSALEF